MTYKELLGTIVFFILAVFALAGCQEPFCPIDFPLNETVYFYVNPEVKNDWRKVQKGLDMLQVLGYDFKVAGNPKVARIEIIPMNLPLNTDGTYRAGSSLIPEQQIGLRDDMGDHVPFVIAHETMHMLGVFAHIDENLHPGTCNIMNANVCGGVYELTDLDLELYKNRVHCEGNHYSD